MSTQTSSELMDMLCKELATDHQKLFLQSFHWYLHHDADRDFVVDFENVFEWLGFKQKSHAMRRLSTVLTQDEYTTTSTQGRVDHCDGTSSNAVGRPRTTVLMTVNGFKKFCLRAATKEAERIREYYIIMEKVMMDFTNRHLQSQLKSVLSQLEIERRARLEDRQATQELQQALQSEVQSASGIARHTALITSNLNRPVVYLARVQFMPNNQYLLKIGETNDIKQRVSDHRSEFTQSFVLLDVISCVFAHALEQETFKLPVLANRRHTQPLGRSNREQREVFLVDDDIYKKLLPEIVKAQKVLERGDKTTLELQSLEVERILAINARLIAENERLKSQQAHEQFMKRCELTQVAITAGGQPAQQVLPAQPIKVIFNPDRRFTQARGDKVQQYSPDGRTLIRTHVGLTDANRHVRGTLQAMKTAAKTRKLYKNFRWAFLKRDQPDDTVQDIGSTVESRTQTRGLVAMLSPKGDRIECVYCDMKEAGEQRDVKMSAISRAVKLGTKCRGSLWKPWDACDEHMKLEWIAHHTLPEPRVRVNGQVVLQLDPISRQVQRTFSSMCDVLKAIRSGRKQLKEAIAKGTILHQSIWVCVNNNEDDIDNVNNGDDDDGTSSSDELL